MSDKLPLSLRQYPFIWTYSTKNGTVLTTGSSSILWRSPTFDFWHSDLKERSDKAPMARGASVAMNHILDLYFYFTSPSSIILTAASLLIEGSANVETNDAQADLQTLHTIGTAALRSPSAL